MKYANLASITQKLKGRLSVVTIESTGITGIATQEIEQATVELLVDEIELGEMDTYIGMIYEMPLKLTAPSTINYLKMVAEDLAIAHILDIKFPSQTDTENNNDNFASVTRQRGLDRLQALFSGTGIFVAGANPAIQAIQNDANAPQLVNHNIVLAEEKLKQYIGYDYNGDSISDTDIFKQNTIDPSFYFAGDFDDEVGSGGGEFIVDGIQTRKYLTPLSQNIRNRETISFW